MIKSIRQTEDNTLRFNQENDMLRADERTKAIIGKSVTTWDELDFGLSQQLVKNGYKIAIEL